jgi:peroxiredoxin
VVVISRGSIEANRAKATEHALTTMLVQTDNEVATAYQVAPEASVERRPSRWALGDPAALR